MDLNQSDKTNEFSRLGKTLCWFTKTENANKIFLGLALFCSALFLADFTYHKHVHTAHNGCQSLEIYHQTPRKLLW